MKVYPKRFFVYFDSQTKIRLDHINRISKFRFKNLEFVDSGFVDSGFVDSGLGAWSDGVLGNLLMIFKCDVINGLAQMWFLTTWWLFYL